MVDDKKSDLARKLEAIWRDRPAAWSHHRAGWGTLGTLKTRDKGGFFTIKNEDNLVMKKGNVVSNRRPKWKKS